MRRTIIDPMATADGFHPDFDETTTAAVNNRVHHVRASDISSDTAQSEGLRRFAALSGASVGAEKLWMGETHAMPSTVSSNHHHGDSETAIYVRSGHPEFVFHDGTREVRIATSPGDYSSSRRTCRTARRTRTRTHRRRWSSRAAPRRPSW